MIEETRIENLKPITEPLEELIEVQKTAPLLALPPPPPPPMTPKPLSRITEGPLTPTRTVIIGNIAKGYLSHSFKKENDTDHTYGIRLDNMAYKIGNKVVEIKSNDI